MGLLSCLFGCGSDSPYSKKGGKWYFKKDEMQTEKGEELVTLNKHFAKSARTAWYESSWLGEVDAATFEALTDHYAKDKNSVWYCDTYRNSQEYWSVKHYRTPKLNADAKTFRMLDNYYARDTNYVWRDGEGFTVRDINTYERLGDAHARDKVTGYFGMAEIKGSDPATFVAVDGKYSKDAKHVYYSVFDSDKGAHKPFEKTIIMAGADPATFVSLDKGYASDVRQAYYKGDVLTKSVSTFRLLDRGYAIADDKVYYDGQLLKDADAATFVVLEVGVEDAWAKDKNGKFQYDERMKQ